MRLYAVTPIRVAKDELQRRRDRYQQLAPAEVSVDLHNLDALNAPTSLETETDIRRSEELVFTKIAALDPGAYDAALPDCVLDPSVDHFDTESNLPVFGMLRLTAAWLVGTGHVFGAVTRNAAIGAELADRLDGYRLERGFTRAVTLDLDFASIADDTRWNAALADAVISLTQEKAMAVINGCSAAWPSNPPGEARVIDPACLALRLISAGTAVQEVTC